MTELNDNELVSLSLEGDDIAFGILVKRYEVKMYRTARGIVKDYEAAKDVTQAGFLKCWEKLETFKSDYKFYSWLYRIMVNESLNHVRSKKNHMEIQPDQGHNQNPLEELMKEEKLKSLADAIDELSLDHRMVIQLKHFEGLSYEDISLILDIDKKTVKSRLYSARIKLRDLLIR